jgi:Protein of unknown function (DUF2591)
MSEFIEVKTQDLIGAALDWAVAEVTGDYEGISVRLIAQHYQPSTDWRMCGPLIAEHRVSLIYSDETCDPCAWTDSTAPWHGGTPLIAACRAIVASAIGETVSVPKELLP